MVKSTCWLLWWTIRRGRMLAFTNYSIWKKTPPFMAGGGCSPSIREYSLSTLRCYRVARCCFTPGRAVAGCALIARALAMKRRAFMSVSFGTRLSHPDLDLEIQISFIHLPYAPATAGLLTFSVVVIRSWQMDVFSLPEVRSTMAHL